MFGYVRPPAHDLSPEHLERFRQMYCGLCHTLGRRYGSAGRWILNYDFTFLAILLSGQTDFPVTAQSAAYEVPQSAEVCPYTVKKSRCMAHPLRPRTYLDSTPVMELAADESVILTWWKLRDSVTDDPFPRHVPALTVSGLLRGAYRKAAGHRPEFDRTVQFQLARLREIERAKVPSLDIPADAFAQILRGAADEMPVLPLHSGAAQGMDFPAQTQKTSPFSDARQSGHFADGQRISRDADAKRRITGHILYHLGRWIYLIDAADDLSKDVRTGNYNPVALRYGLREGVWTPSARREFARTLDASIHQMAAAFELWDFGVWTPVLRETLYRGLFQTGRAVLDGTFHVCPECFYHPRPFCGRNQTVPRLKTVSGSQSLPGTVPEERFSGTADSLPADHAAESLSRHGKSPYAVIKPDSGNQSGQKRGETVS